jgi:ABC-type histidine transport system ATPase subunit
MRSFMRKPPSSGDAFGVVNRKLKVHGNVSAAPRLPMALSPGHQRRTPISTPSAISMMPMMFDAPCTLVTPSGVPASSSRPCRS